MSTLLEDRDATLSADGLYRYDLTRRWGDGGLVCWIMCNPSTADGSEDDPTIRRVRAFTLREQEEWGEVGGFVVVNLFALRVTQPIHLTHHPDPVGLANDEFILRHYDPASFVVAAWGVHGALFDRDLAVRRLLTRRVWEPGESCLGTTKAGHPRHPLYVSKRTPLRPFHPRSAA